MPLTCNIDAKGKKLRFIVGFLFSDAAVVLGVMTALLNWPWWVYLAALGMLLGGLFMIFEARAGWCAVRAMGFKTPI